ncbi:BTAD domain-containing putative transcriptional regulator [Actinophytocola sp.]|uniref:AfsR/SARP family transcriptional regulator n=1 Tax=Actinophytocola sp. TaxID=1872138 RepID=UPI003D6C0A90
MSDGGGSAGWSAEFRLLGSVEVVRDGRPLASLAAQPRCVLAVLLLGAGDVVSTDRLIDAIWGERPPEEPRNAVQVYVSRLRRLLTGAGSVVIGTAGRHGYRMQVPPDSVDLFRFRRLVAEASSAGGARVVDTLDEALALWRGDPFGGAAGDWLHRQVTPTLEAEYLRAREERARALGRLGRHGEAIGELSTLLADHPTHEQVATSLMSALHATGRTAEALAVYRDLRAGLVEELGLEPGEAVRRLHESILAGDGAAGEEPGRPGGPVVPAQLPADVPLFVGRDDLARSMCDRLTARGAAPRVVVVAGAGGSGKSTLAVHVAHLVRGEFGDGQLFATLSAADPVDVLADFLLALGTPQARIPGTLEQRAALFRSATAGRELLVVLDDARDAAQVRPLLPGHAGCAVLVTSRSRLAALEATDRVPVEGLPAAEAVGLLSSMLGAERVAAEPEAAAELARHCGHLPLALRVSAARLTNRPQWPIRMLAERLADERARLDELALGDLDVRASFMLSYQQLDPDAARAFRLWSLAAARSLPEQAAAAMLGAARRAADAVAETLTDLHLLDLTPTGHLRLHDLLRQLGRDLAGELDLPEVREDALGRLTGWYAHSFAAALAAALPGVRPARYLLPGAEAAARFGTAAEALSWLDTERAALAAVVLDAAGRNLIPPRDLVWVAANFGRYAGPRGYLTEWRQLCRSAVDAAQRFGDRRSEARAMIAMGAVAHRSHELDAAADHLRWAAGEVLDSGDPTEATAIGNLALVYESLQHRGEVVAHLTRAHDIYEQVGDVRGQANALVHLGRQRTELGDLDEASSLFGRALELIGPLAAADLEAGAHNGLADAARLRDQPAAADRHYQAALEIGGATKNPEIQGTALAGIARLRSAAGRTAAAIDHLEQAISAFRYGQFDSRLAPALVELGALLRGSGQSERADICLAEATALASRLGGAEANVVRARIDELTAG